MRVAFLAALVIGCASTQYVKSGVKGGYGGQGYQHRAGENLINLFGNRTQHGSTQQTVTHHEENAVGLCFIEVPTASLVKDPRHVPAGNGSRPDLSVIRSCCPGYERNIYNYRLCEPVCTKQCVNAICSAPETCTCFPDHVRNYDGVCISTCPIGCQHGRCAGGECICNEGFALDRDSKYCIPTCRENCGGIGSCTGPNICTCRAGYQSTPEGSCKPACDRCTNGLCVAPNDCQCNRGYTRDARGDCVSQCAHGCAPNEICVGVNKCELVTVFVPGQGPYQPNHYPPYSGQRNQTSLPFYPNQPGQGHLGQNSTPTYFRPDYPQSRPYYPYPNQYPTNPDQSRYPDQYPGAPQPDYVVQPIGHPSYYPPTAGNQLGNYPAPNASSPYQPHQPGYQLANQPNQTYPGYTPNYYFQPGYYQPNMSSPHQNHHGQQPSFQPINYQPMNPNPYFNPQNNTLTGQPLYPYQGNTTLNQQFYPQPNYFNHNGTYPNGPSYPGSQANYTNYAYPSQNGTYPTYNEPNSSYPGHQPYPIQEHSTNRSPNFFNPYNSDYNQQYGQQSLCSPPCINGECVGENRCSCSRGYVPDHSDPSGARCKPVCVGGCVNGVCTAPNMCVCSEGYSMDTSVKGRMICMKRIRRSADQPTPKKPKSVVDV